MSEGLGFIGEEKDEVAGFGLRPAQFQTQPDTVDGLGILAPGQAVARPAPAQPPFSLSRMLSRDCEIGGPPRRSISARNRGIVQFGRFSTGSDRIVAAIDNARSPRSPDGPGATAARKPSTPPLAYQPRQCRTESAVTSNATPIASLVQPSSDNRIARARSASSRRSERASAFNSPTCFPLAVTQARLAMIKIRRHRREAQTLPSCDSQGNPA